MGKFIITSFLLTICFAVNLKGQSIETFKKDPAINTIATNVKIFVSVYEQEDQLEASKVFQSIDSAVDSIIKTYGEEKVNNYLTILVEEERKSEIAGEAKNQQMDKCHLKPNGTVNGDDCNFWEYIVVAIQSARYCNRPGWSPSRAEINSYYLCVQGVICKSC